MKYCHSKCLVSFYSIQYSTVQYSYSHKATQTKSDVRFDVLSAMDMNDITVFWGVEP